MGEAGWEQSVPAEDPFPGPKGLEWGPFLIMRVCDTEMSTMSFEVMSLSTRDSLLLLPA